MLLMTQLSHSHSHSIGWPNGKKNLNYIYADERFNLRNILDHIVVLFANQVHMLSLSNINMEA